MLIRGDRLRWPPRPGKKSGDSTLAEIRRPLPSGTQSADAKLPLQQPDKADMPADHDPAHPREPVHQGHDEPGQ